jgi:hypothetical protein
MRQTGEKDEEEAEYGEFNSCRMEARGSLVDLVRGGRVKVDDSHAWMVEDARTWGCGGSP